MLGINETEGQAAGMQALVAIYVRYIIILQKMH